MFTYIDILRFIQIGSHAALILAGRIREYLIQLPGPRLQRLLHGDLYTCIRKDQYDLPVYENVMRVYDSVLKLMAEKKITAAYALTPPAPPPW